MAEILMAMLGVYVHKKALESATNPRNLLVPCTIPVPFVLTGNVAFALTTYLLKPYPSKNLTVEQRITDHKISRGRRKSENILGILGNRWCCFRVPFVLEPEKVKRITLAILALHNWLSTDARSSAVNCPFTTMDQEDRDTGDIIEGTWGEDTTSESSVDLQPTIARSSTNEAKLTRVECNLWFNNGGDSAISRSSAPRTTPVIG